MTVVTACPLGALRGGRRSIHRFDTLEARAARTVAAVPPVGVIALVLAALVQLAWMILLAWLLLSVAAG